MHFSIGSSILKALKVPFGPDVFLMDVPCFPNCLDMYSIGSESGPELKSPINIT